MVLPLTYYGNPILRQKGEPVEDITPELTQLIQDMFDTMKEHRGIGLAAQQIGKTIQFKNVLLLNDKTETVVGNPNISGAIVEAKLLKNVKDRTVLIFHKRRRKHSRKKNGHRQRHSKIQITKIFSKDGKLVAEAKTDTLKTKKEVKTTKKEKTKKVLKK